MSDFNNGFEAIFGGSDLVAHLASWDTVQESMSAVTRWDQLRAIYEKIRMQTSGEHSFSFSLWVDSVVRKLNREAGAGLDRSLLVLAAMQHDIPEGILKLDVSFKEKKDEHSLAELRAFQHYMEGKSKADQEEIMYAFLVQFAKEMPSCFPEWAKDIMQDILAFHYKEAIFFPFSERYDYLMMGLSYFKATGDPELLKGLIRDHGPELDEAVKELPELAIIWSFGFKARCLKVLEL